MPGASNGSRLHPSAGTRTRSFDYSAMNLAGMFLLARLGEHLGVDLWHYNGEGGRNIRKALAYLAPFTDPRRPWPHEQISPLNRPAMLPLLLQARQVYKDPRVEDWTEQLPADEVTPHRAQLLYARPKGLAD